MGYTVAVVGATGAVGAQMIKMLEESTLPIDKIRYLASARSAGKVLQFKGQDVTIEETTEDAFEGVDIALFSAGGFTSVKIQMCHWLYLRSMHMRLMLTTVLSLVLTVQLSK